MFCHHCGNQIPDDTKFCRHCGAAQEVQGAPASAMPPVYPQSAPRPVVNQEPAYGSIQQVNNTPMQEPDDSVSAGLVILSVFIPLFGIIYWPVKAKTRPKCARACGIASLIAWGLAFLGSIAQMA